jgi:hypothetical protein
MPPKTTSTEQIRQIVERARLVPDSERTFDQSLTAATELHRVPPGLLAELLDLGLPHRGRGDDRRFDDADLGNVGLELGLPCPRRLAMRWWSKSLGRMRQGTRSRFAIDMTAACPEPGHPGGCSFELHPLFRSAVLPGTLRTARTGRFAFDIELDCLDGRFGEPFTVLIERARRFRFHLLPRPDGVTTDLGFLAETGLADCRLATRYLAGLGRDWGLPVRGCVGFFVAPPYAQEHAWLEFRMDGRWWPADPFLLDTLARWGIADPRVWPPDRSPSGLLWRLSNQPILGVAHRGAATAVRLALVGREETPVCEAELR